MGEQGVSRRPRRAVRPAAGTLAHAQQQLLIALSQLQPQPRPRAHPQPMTEWSVDPPMWVAAMPVAAVTPTTLPNSSPHSCGGQHEQDEQTLEGCVVRACGTA